MRTVWQWSILTALVTAACAAPPASEPSQEPAPAGAAAPRTGPVAPPTTDPEMIASAMSAAPDSIAREATIVAIDDKGQFRTLREGAGLFTCIPDGPSPGVDPMCVDRNGLDWVKAWIGRQPPPADKVGFGYMLAGGSDASNEDPFATAPAAGHAWIETGPHVMVFNSGGKMDGYPTSHDDPRKPYVMWAGTPYEHLMIPVR